MAHAKGHTVARSIHSTAHIHGSYTAHTQITQHTAYTHCIYTLHIHTVHTYDKYTTYRALAHTVHARAMHATGKGGPAHIDNVLVGSAFSEHTPTPFRYLRIYTKSLNE